MALNVRYIVHDVDEAIEFYRDLLGFEVLMHPAPGFAALSRGDLRLYLNAPGAGGAGTAGGNPEPGGWNRFQIEVDDLAAVIDRLSAANATFRGERVSGQGGDQALVEDPSGNPIELFQPAGDSSGVIT
jgi:catechol 2,3-dioxygenase-like lactoylglutathione lyase family enzyme